MKKFLIGLLFLGIFAGFFISNKVSAQGLEGVGDAIEAGAKKVGDVSRQLELFNIKMEYYSRPFSEQDLSLEDWMDLHGYTTYGAGPVPTGSLSLPKAEEFGEVGSNVNLRRFILNVTNWVLGFLGIICIVMIIYAGYVYIITGGEDGHEKGKKIILYVAVGIIVILVSYALVNTIIKSTVEGGDNYVAITLSNNVVNGNVEVSGSNVLDYGSGFIVDSGVNITFTATASNPTNSTYSTPYDLQWSFGDGTITNSQAGQNTITRTFFDDGFKNIVVLGKIKETTQGQNGTEEKVHDYMARVRILVGDSVIANFNISPLTPHIGDTVNFDARSSQALVGMIDSYSWTCSPSNLCSGFTSVNDNELSALFNTAGTVTVTLTVTPNVGNPATFSKTFEISSLPTSSTLQARFNVSTITPVKDSAVHFVGQALPVGTVPDSFTWECQPMGNTNINICTDFNANAAGNLEFFAEFSEAGNAKISLIVEKNGQTSLPYEKVIHVTEPNTASRPAGSDLNISVPAAARVAQSVDLSVTTQNQNYVDFRWNLPSGLQTGNNITTTFDNVGTNDITLEALDSNGDVANTLAKTVLVVEQGKPIPGLKINGKTVYPNSTINILKGDNLSFQTNSTDTQGNTGPSAQLVHSWVLNGSVINESDLANISSEVGTYSLKLNAISTLDSNKRSSLQFKIKVARKAPKITLSVNKSSLGEGFYKLKAKAETEGDIKNYKFEVLENGKIVSTQVINSTEKEVETIMDVSNKIGKHNYSFQVIETEKDGAIAKKIVNKQVEIKPGEVTNNPPTAEIYVTPATSGLTSTMFRFYVQADDLDNDYLTYKWEFPNGKKVAGKTVSHRFETAGVKTIKLTVSDGIAEIETTETIKIEDDPNFSQGNHSPVILSSGMSPGNTGDTDTIFKFYALADDPDGDELEYSWITGDGNRLNLQNVSYQYQYPGRYSAKLLVSDGIKTVMRTIPIIVVAKGENIPASTIDNYENSHDITNTGFPVDEVGISTSLTEQNVAGFMDQVTTTLDTKKLELSGETDPDKRLILQKEITLMNNLDSMYSQYKLETDTTKKKSLLNQINQKRLELESLDAKLKFNFVGLEGTVNTKFFFYGKLPKTNSPVLIKWDTGDGRTFIGQNVSWKYSKEGNYIVQMNVSDGVSVATDTINIKIK